jgi:hypothetical protein
VRAAAGLSAAAALVAVAVLLGLAAVPAPAERGQDGEVIGSFDARLNPTRLPRTEPAPIGVRVAGDFEVESGDVEALPQLRRIRVAINREGRLYDRGLPVCPKRRLRVATRRAARRTCGDALIGHGSLVVRVKIPTQASFPVKAGLLVFNGPRRGGRRHIYAHAYAPKPPGSFLLTFRVSQRRGVFGAVLTTTLPRSARSWAFLTHFDMTLRRTYVFHGKRRSYVSAACAAPAGFSSATFPFARAIYDFADGERISIPVARTCHVRA